MSRFFILDLYNLYADIALYFSETMEEDASVACDSKTTSEGKNYIIIKGSFMKLAKLKAQK